MRSKIIHSLKVSLFFFLRNPNVFLGFDWKNFRRNNGPIIPCNQTTEEIQKRFEGSYREMEEKKNLLFNNLGFDPKARANKVIDMGGFLLRRLDVLDKLNQDTYLSLQQ